MFSVSKSRLENAEANAEVSRYHVIQSGETLVLCLQQTSPFFPCAISTHKINSPKRYFHIDEHRTGAE